MDRVIGIEQKSWSTPHFKETIVVKVLHWILLDILKHKKLKVLGTKKQF